MVSHDESFLQGLALTHELVWEETGWHCEGALNTNPRRSGAVIHGTASRYLFAECRVGLNQAHQL